MIHVLGANGQLGSCLLKLNEDIKSYTRNDIDFTLPDSIIDLKFNPGDVVINCTAYTQVDVAEDEESLAMQVNAQSMKPLAMICKNQNAHLVHISTDYVFDGKKNSPYCENDETNALGVYAKSKLFGEKELESVGCNYTIVRTSWLYSETHHNFVNTMIKLSEKDSISVVNDQFGTPTYAPDLANVLLQIAKNPEVHRDEIYHYSGEGECSWYDFASEIMKELGSDCVVKPVTSAEYPTKAPRPRYTVLSKEKIKKNLNIAIPHWKDSLKKCIQNRKKANL